jgi:Pyruvate:ferredoxin oxidoreductase and related 2-oxoacid:ferredoxin oxidoreductases, alpha subunit
MSEALEAEQKTNPQGDPITSVAAPKADLTSGRKDPHAEAKRQKVVTPEYMFLEAPRTKEFITGSEAAKEAVRRSSVDLAIAYPITPQSETMQLIGVLYGEGYVKEYYRGEEEVGSDGGDRRWSRAGVRCFTATAGPGTLRGMEGIASWPGHRLPAVAMFTCRVVNAPLAIQPDNIEVAYLLNCGMIVSTLKIKQDMYDFIMAGFTISEKNDVTLPVGVCCDGFFVTHARGYVRMQDRGMRLPPREAWRGAVPCSMRKILPLVCRATLRYRNQTSWPITFMPCGSRKCGLLSNGLASISISIWVACAQLRTWTVPKR